MYSKKIRINSQSELINLTFVILVSIFLLALLLRLWGANFGLRYKEYFHPDENTVVSKAVYVAKHFYYPNPHFFAYPSLYIYVQTFLYILSYPLRKLGLDFNLIGRSFTAFLGAFSCVLVYFIGKKVFNKKVGIFSALILAIIPVHVQTSHYITVDIPVTFLTLIVILFLLEFIEKRSLRYLYRAAIFAGLSISTKYNFVVLIPIFLTYLFYEFWKSPLSKKIFNIVPFRLIFYVLLFFLIGTPFALLDRKQFLTDFIAMVRQSSHAVGMHGADDSNGVSTFVWYIKYMFTTGVTYPICIFGTIGLLNLLLKLNKRAMPMLLLIPINGL